MSLETSLMLVRDLMVEEETCVARICFLAVASNNWIVHVS